MAPLLGLLGALYGLTWLMEICVGILFAVAAHTALTRLRCAMFANLVQQDVAFYDTHVSGERPPQTLTRTPPNPHPNRIALRLLRHAHVSGERSAHAALTALTRSLSRALLLTLCLNPTASQASSLHV